MHPDEHSRRSAANFSLLSIKEACARASCGRSMLYDLAASGRIRIYKLGSSSKIRSDELDAFIASLPVLHPRPGAAE